MELVQIGHWLPFVYCNSLSSQYTQREIDYNDVICELPNAWVAKLSFFATTMASLFWP